jgi:hypothetical protein
VRQKADREGMEYEYMDSRVNEFLDPKGRREIEEEKKRMIEYSSIDLRNQRKLKEGEKIWRIFIQFIYLHFRFFRDSNFEFIQFS